MKLEILDSKGEVIRKYSSKKEEPKEKQQEWDAPDESEPLPVEVGMNRFTWDLKYEAPHKVPGVVLDGGDEPEGPWVVPGTYQVRLTALGKSLTQSVDVTLDPRLKTSQGDLQKQLELALKLRTSLNQTHDAIREILDVRSQLDALQARLAKDAAAKSIVEQAKALEDTITPIQDALYNKNIQSTEDSLNYPVRLNNKLSVLGELVESADTAPTEQSGQLYEVLARQADELAAKWNEVKSKELAALNVEIRKKDIPAIAPLPAKEE